MVKKVLIGFVVVLLVAVLGFVAAVSMQSDEFRVTRSATIDAPPEAVFPHVNNLRKWQVWSPWAKLDPDATHTFKGPDQGKGAECHWDGNDQIGAGNMTIIESKPAELVRYELNFIRPYEDSCEVDFLLKPEGDATQVTWDMRGENTFMAKVMCLFMDMEAMVGGDFEKGLASLKEVAEKDDAPSAEDSTLETNGEAGT